MSEPTIQAQIDIRARYFYLLCVLIFAIRFASSCLFSQLSQPVLIGPGIDNTYWAFHWLGIPYLATHSVVWSAVLDILLFLLPVIASIVSGRRIFAFLFTLLAFTYQITYSTYATHHYHSLIGILVLSVPFWAGPGRRFTFLWEAARYYFFFIFSSAALWKLSRGTVWDSGHISSVLMAQHVQAIYEYPASMLTRFHSYLICHAGVARLFFLAGFLVQLSFLGGFFTKKYDKVYMALFIAFFAMNYLVMGIYDLEILIFLLVLLDWDKIGRGTGDGGPKQGTGDEGRGTPSLVDR
jgi:hypothetical protein